MKARSEKGGTMQIRLNKPDGPLLGEVKIPAGTEFAIVTAKARTLPQGVQNIVVLSTNANIKEVDWVKFE